MISKTRQLLIAVFLLGSAPVMFAQNDGNGGGITPYVSFGFNFAQGHGHDLTEKTWGGIGAFTGEAGIEFFHPYAGLSLRPNVGYAKILGEPLNTKVVYDLLAFYAGFDIIYNPIKKRPMSITVGPSFHSWSIEMMNADGNPGQGNRSSLQFGWRFGAGYEVMNNLRLDLTFTQSEWRSLNTRPYVVGYNPSRPAYFTLYQVADFRD